MAQHNNKCLSSPSLMNHIWFFLISSSIILAAWSGDMASLTEVSFNAARKSVNLAIGLAGAMALWLGLVRIAEEAGMMTMLARLIRPVMARLFPDIPPDHPAMSAMVMNMAANAMGLGNAATPLGIKAMSALNRLNPCPGTATDAMCLFLAINTSNVTILPLGTIAIRASAGASEPASIILPSILATGVSTVVAIMSARILRKAERVKSPLPCQEHNENSAGSALLNLQKGEDVDSSRQGRVPGLNNRSLLIVTVVAFGMLGACLWNFYSGKMEFSQLASWIVPVLILLLTGFGYARNVPVYEAGVKGAKEGFKVAVRLIPFLVMILVAAALFRESGAFRSFAALVEPATSLFHIPSEVIPMALLRPLSGSGAFGLMSEITVNAPDSYAAFLAATIQGSTETTFYVLAVYFGSVGITKTRYALTAALAADVAGFAASVFFCSIFWNH